MSATQEFGKRLEDQLTQRSVPAKFGTEILIELLMELLINLFDSCLGDLPDSKVASRMSDLSFLDKIRLRSRIRRQLFSGSGRDYRNNHGPEMLESLVATSEGSTNEEAMALVREMREDPAFPPPEDTGWVF